MTEVSITCPRCGMISHNPTDVRQGYCNNCHDWTSPSISEPHPSSFDMDPADLLAGAHRFTQAMQAYKDAELEKLVAKAETELEEELAVKMAKTPCPGCGGRITIRYWEFGVCANCYNTTDDPEYPR